MKRTVGTMVPYRVLCVGLSIALMGACGGTEEVVGSGDAPAEPSNDASAPASKPKKDTKSASDELDDLDLDDFDF